MIVDCAHYKDGKRQDEEILDLEHAASCAEGGDDFVWVGLHEPTADELDRAGELFGLHELALEDAELSHHRAKMEDYDDSFFVVLKTAFYDEQKEEVIFGEIHLFLGNGYVIAVRHGDASELQSARKRLEARPDLLRIGPVAAAWAIVDKVVDDYAPVAEGIEDDIEEVEADVFNDDIPAPTQRIYFLKREVIEFYRALFPLLAPLDALEAGAYAETPDELKHFFRDVSDHVKRIVEQVASQRELLTSILEANLALVSLTQNDVIKRISSYAGIIAVPTFIASVYGMNFEHMPELGSAFGYPLCLVLMAVIVFGLVRYFKRVNWL